ncbi:MAG: hypothetical protein SNI70_08485 [Rikenellaceae bacterium]
MRSFYRGVISFAIFIVIIYGVILFCFNFYLEKEIEKTNTIRSTTRVLAMGDSHLECGVNDITDDVFENRSRMSERYYQVYLKLKYILENSENKDKLKAICLTYNTFSLKKSQDSLYCGVSPNHHFVRNYSPMFRDYYNRPQLYHLPIDSKSYCYSYVSSYMVGITDIRDWILHGKVRNLFEFHGSFINEDKKHIKSFTKKEKDSNWDSDVELSNIQKDHLKLIATLARTNNIQLVLVNAPCHKYYNLSVNPKLVAANTEFANQLNRDYGVIYLDFHNAFLHNKCFRDYEHLSVDGANIFTPMLRDTLISLGLY